eukprot:SAG11_NODE_8201_length_1047_cov_12.265823_2_plen_116_part_00
MRGAAPQSSHMPTHAAGGGAAVALAWGAGEAPRGCSAVPGGAGEAGRGEGVLWVAAVALGAECAGAGPGEPAAQATAYRAHLRRGRTLTTTSSNATERSGEALVLHLGMLGRIGT